MSQTSNSTTNVAIATNVAQPPGVCKSEYENAACQHRTRLLVIMAIGLQINGIVFNQAAVDGNLLPTKNKEVWKPSTDSCNFEIRRRRVAMGMEVTKYSDRRLAIHMKYL